MENTTPPIRQEMLEKIRENRAHLESLLPGLSEEQVSKPFSPEGWSIKDILAHIAAWERFAIGRLQAAFAGRPLSEELLLANTDFDRMNEIVFAKNKDLSYPAVRQEFEAAHREMLAFVENLDDSVFKGEIRADWAAGRPVWDMIGGNTLWHYAEHSETIEKWLAG